MLAFWTGLWKRIDFDLGSTICALAKLSGCSEIGPSQDTTCKTHSRLINDGSHWNFSPNDRDFDHRIELTLLAWHQLETICLKDALDLIARMH